MDAASEDLTARLAPALAASRYLQRELNGRPWLAQALAASLDKPLNQLEMRSFLEREAPDDECLKAGLRLLRSWVVCHTVCRDLLGLAPLDEVFTAMSSLAEVAVVHACDRLYQSLSRIHGGPRDTSDQPMQLIVLGMGKLGGGELNVSSDIDLIFVYPDEGETQGDRPLSHFEFFSRLGRQLIAALGEVTADGFVFRVDMRLRPYGESGPLAISIDALSHYLITQGRDWERYAWIKARPLCGSSLDRLAAVVKPFVFRKYLDFGAINGLRGLHGQIRRQAARREMAMNIKLGPGGIREIEFIAQVFQIIRGGREPALQQRSTLAVLETLGRCGVLDRPIVVQLQEAYRFLRNLEHRLQYVDDAQVHDLPGSAEELQRIAVAMGYDGSQSLMAALEQHRRQVSNCFQDVFGEPAETGDDSSELWDSQLPLEQIESALVRRGFRDSGRIARRLTELRRSGGHRQLSEKLRNRLESLLPRLVEGSGGQPDPDGVLLSLLNLVEAINGREAYLALLLQYPQALRRLIELVAVSKWAADYLARHPVLLDELLDGRNLESVTSWPEFAAQLRNWLAAAESDTERQMDLLREHYHAQVFRILHQDIAGKWAVEEIGDHLSALADLILAETMHHCWRKIGKRHREVPAFAVIAYGKLGGKELGYASDLDIIFLYRDDDPAAFENYVKLAQRMMTWLSSTTSAGTLFEIDTRLRPNGRSGLLVSQIDAFRTYQLNSAWLWEHQALTRARFVAGDREVGDRFEELRTDVLRQQRDPDLLAAEIVAMRQRLYDSHPTKEGLFNLKDDPGGLVDFEFIVQFLVLCHAHRHPELVANLGNIALSRIASELGLIDGDRASAAANAYRTLRRVQHRQRLNNGDNWLPEDQEKGERRAIRALWTEVFGKA